MPPQILILDPSLRDKHSHHHAVNTGLIQTGCAQAAGLRVLAHRSASPDAFEYPVSPVFQHSIYEDTGAQSAVMYAELADAFRRDLDSAVSSLGGVALLLHSTTAALLKGLLDRLLERRERPASIVIQLMFHPRAFLPMGATDAEANLRYKESLTGLRRYCRLRDIPLRISTSCAEFARCFGALLGDTIPVHPAVMQHTGPARRETSTLRILLHAGDPKPDKGLEWVVAALPALLARLPRAEFHIHTGPDRFRHPTVTRCLAALEGLSRDYPALQWQSGHLEPESWLSLLRGASVVLLPYASVAYGWRSSGILWECLSALAPDARLLVTEGTWLERECVAAGAGFSRCRYGDTAALLRLLEDVTALPPVGDLPARADHWWEDTFSETNADYLLRQLQNPSTKAAARFLAEPAAWWHAQEALRIARAAEPRRLSQQPLLLYSPRVLLNSYQEQLYEGASRAGVQVLPMARLDIFSPVLAAATRRTPVFYHQHWLRDVFWGAKSREDGLQRIARHVGTLRAMKGLGFRVLWTVHNLVEHDASPLHKELGETLLAGMATHADRILVHYEGAAAELSELTGVDVIVKSSLLAHPLYDHLLRLGENDFPPEVGLPANLPKRIWLMTGLIRPYKGASELLQAWQTLLSSQHCSPHLVIAGDLRDPSLPPLIESLIHRFPGALTVIPRRLGDAELATLVRHCELMIAPYRNVHTSGTYFLASTFRKPVLAPRRGMFARAVDDGKTGWLYDGTNDGLVLALQTLLREPQERFRQLGEAAWQLNARNRTPEISDRFFRLLSEA
jgi:glycosyltransferase involved in cell wall biosynthesis